jgi:hypothetical protein
MNVDIKTHDLDFVRADFGKRKMLLVAHGPSFAS